ncbi:MAG: MBL fold metallo-hydrolase [Proteobacteria bacterium]|nr:MBL fold metallo-hydrolase [Pseudomonadota bacterium]MBU1056951.1 MBL fold metallo-hydrolase [Pseudomonadota bacterium]
MLTLTHSHPDHIGSAKSIKELTGCTVFSHKLEQEWIEDIEQQVKDRSPWISDVGCRFCRR